MGYVNIWTMDIIVRYCCILTLSLRRQDVEVHRTFAMYQYILFIVIKAKSIREKNHKYYYVCMSTAFINRETKSCWIHILLTCVYFFSPSQPKREFSINWTFS